MEKIARNQLIKIAYENPELRDDLLKIITASMEKESALSDLAKIGLGGALGAAIMKIFSFHQVPATTQQDVIEELKNKPGIVLTLKETPHQEPEALKKVLVKAEPALKEYVNNTSTVRMNPPNVSKNIVAFQDAGLTSGAAFAIITDVIQHIGSKVDLADELKGFEGQSALHASAEICANKIGTFSLLGTTKSKAQVFEFKALHGGKILYVTNNNNNNIKITTGTEKTLPQDLGVVNLNPHRGDSF